MENITYIIKGCIEKNHKYQRIIYERYRSYALKIVFRYIYRFERAINVTNDGFVKLFRNFEQFRLGEEGDNEAILMGWLKKILVNTAIDELRKDDILIEIGGIPENVWEIKDNNQGADQLLLYKDLIVLIKSLPTPYRIVFNLYVIDGYTHSEIADILKVPVGTSKSNLSRARLLLQNSIKKMEENSYAGYR
ncbi:MAG: sigma-70 family RNA polymerase sigma factor [Chitinophagaceae bacterium]